MNRVITISTNHDACYFSSLPDSVILFKIILNDKNKGGVMSVTINTEAGSRKYKLFPGEDRIIEEAAPAAPAAKTSRERNELLIRLNQLAQTRPFNILFRVKKYETL